VSRHFRPIGALTTVAVGSLLLAFGIASPAAADDYPSWDDVLQARDNEAATAAAVNEIEGILVRLESQAADLGRAAQVKGEAYNIAKYALDVASDKAARLEQQADRADDRAQVSIRRAGQLVAQFARAGGGSVTLDLLMSAESDDLLNRLGTMSKLTEQSTLIYQQATHDRNLARALTDQADVAEQQRKELARDAQAAFDAAESASAAARALVVEQQAAAEQLYEQLATLKGTTAQVERDYLAGIADPPPANPGMPNPGTPGPGTPGPAPSSPGTPDPAPSNPAPPAPVDPTPPAPSPSAVEGAIAYASAQLGDRYEFAGYGPDAWDCSGLTKASYASVGVYIGIHGSSSQYTYLANQGRLVPVGQIVRGDLLFYSVGGTTWDTKYHTSIYIGNGQMIEAPYEGVPVRVTSVRYYDLVPYAGRPTG
jgi:cell wall-associated NlpC family hydrolase